MHENNSKGPKPGLTENNKLQAPPDLKIGPNKFQVSNKIKRQLFGILNFDHCYLFGICVLLFEIF